MSPTMRRYFAEFFGTFVLVFIGTGVATLQGLFQMGPAGWIGVSLAFGFTLMVLVLTIGPVSGCHINPAVTIGALVAGRMEASKVVGYIVCQCVGGIVASATLLTLLRGIPAYSIDANGLGANGNPHHLAIGSLLMFEVIMTAIFLTITLSVTRQDAEIAGTKSPAFAAIAIGGFLFVSHLLGAPLGDSSLNPARSLGPAIFQGSIQGAVQVLWVFVVGPLIGGVCGAGVYRLVHMD